MAARQSMDHDGFYSDRGPMGALAENVAWGCATESCAMRMWENSSGHRANMLLSDVKNYAWRRPRADERGIGALSSADSDAQNVNNLFAAVHAT
jgi:hypothetical protein